MPVVAATNHSTHTVVDSIVTPASRQVSDPVDLPGGVYVYRRLPPRDAGPGG